MQKSLGSKNQFTCCHMLPHAATTSDVETFFVSTAAPVSPRSAVMNGFPCAHPGRDRAAWPERFAAHQSHGPGSCLGPLGATRLERETKELYGDAN